MSRIGKLGIAIPSAVTVTVNNNVLTAKGPLGTLTQEFDARLNVVIEGGNLFVKTDGSAELNVKQGLYRALFANMVKGVADGFTRTLIINGVGFKAVKTGKKLTINLGFSHPVEFEDADGVTTAVNSNTEVVVKGFDKEKVGQFAAKIRSSRPVEPYHAYGVRYSDEVVVRKVGKTTGKK